MRSRLRLRGSHNDEERIPLDQATEAAPTKQTSIKVRLYDKRVGSAKLAPSKRAL